MRYIDQWLSGLGLEHVIPKLTEHGITTPKKLAQLSLRDMYEIVGIEDAEDRKKLFYLIQRLNAIFKKEQGRGGSDAVDQDGLQEPPDSPRDSPGVGVAAVEETMEDQPQKTSIKLAPSPIRKRADISTVPADGSVGEEGTVPNRMLSASGTSIGTNGSNEEDLKVLRRQRRTSNDSGYNSISSNGAADAVRNISPADANGKDLARKSDTESQASALQRQINLRSSPINLDTEYAPPPTANENSDKRDAGYKPVAFSALSDNSSSAAPGYVTAKVLARRQQRATAAAETDEGLGGNSNSAQSSFPPPVAGSITSNRYRVGALNYPETNFHIASSEQTSFNDGGAARRNVLATQMPSGGMNIAIPSHRFAADVDRDAVESPPPPAPPLSMSGGSIEGNGKFSVDNNNRYQVPPSRFRQPPDGMDYDKQSSQLHGGRQPQYDVRSISTSVESIEISGHSKPLRESFGARIRADAEIDGGVIVRDMAIRVVVRKRPISKSEGARGDRDVLDIEPGGQVFVHEPKTKVDLTKIIETHPFKFDDAFDADNTNESMYGRTVKPLVSILFDFGKASCFAYGQTGSGKTFTMMGSNPASPALVKTNAGLYVLAARDIFNNLRKPEYRNLQVFVSCFEIYGGKLFDLLNDRNVIKCLEDAKQQVQLPGLSEHAVRDVDELLQMMSQAHLLRSCGSTGANEESSRSHQVLQIVLRKPSPPPEAGRARRMGGVVSVKPPPPAQSGKLSFIDLAGSERGADTTNNSKQTRMEGAEINTSLLALKEVIRSLERKQGHTPFRGSKLTQVLKDSFIGDKTRTCMIACVSPSHTNCEHTLNTLRYADRVKEHQLSSNPSPSINAANIDNSVSMYESLDIAQLQQKQLLQQRPNTAAPAGYGDVDLHRASSAGKYRPSTSSSVPTIEEEERVQHMSSRDVDRIRREAELRRGVGHESKSSNIYAEPMLSQKPITTQQSSIAPKFVTKPVATLAAKESKIPGSPMSRFRKRNSLGDISSAPSHYETQKHTLNPDGNTGASGGQYLSSSPNSNKKANPFARQQPQVSEPIFQQSNPVPEDDIVDDLVEASLDKQYNDTALLHKTIDLLSAHKLAIAEMVEVMKEEMELVQDMESSDDRDSERYAEMLYGILTVKSDSIRTLQHQLHSFQQFRGSK